MALIGIIANPSSGKDIRRLVAEAGGIDNWQKVNIVRRVLLGIAAVGVEEVAFMPDPFGIGCRALEDLKLPFRVTDLKIPVQASAEDSLEAARRLCHRGAACIIVLGGDGTHRVVAQVCGRVPLVPISTGTNNVWPQSNEGTLAGLAAALVAGGLVPEEQAIEPTNRLEIRRDGALVNTALVDVAICDGGFAGSKAIWDLGGVKEIVLASVAPGRIGLSAIGGALPKASAPGRKGLHLRLGPGGASVLAAIAPGRVARVPIQRLRWLRPGDAVDVAPGPCILALDGERELVVSRSESLLIRLSDNGPRRVDVPATLQAAARQGFFLQGCPEEF